jgi:hypothetical protein
MDLRDLDRIRFVTRHFQDLQGLRDLVPLGMMSLGQALASPLFYFPGPTAVRLALGLSFLLAAGLGGTFLTSRSRAYYRRLFGEVEVGRWENLRKSLWGLVPAALALLYLLVTGSLSVPRVQCAGFGSVLLYRWLAMECRRSQIHHLLLGGLLTLLAVLGPGIYPAAEDVVAYGASGASWIVAGLLDHRLLVRTLGQLPPPDLDEAGAAMETR